MGTNGSLNGAADEEASGVKGGRVDTPAEGGAAAATSPILA